MLIHRRGNVMYQTIEAFLFYVKCHKLFDRTCVEPCHVRAMRPDHKISVHGRSAHDTLSLSHSRCTLIIKLHSNETKNTSVAKQCDTQLININFFSFIYSRINK